MHGFFPRPASRRLFPILSFARLTTTTPAAPSANNENETKILPATAV